MEKLKQCHEKHASILNRVGQSPEKHATIEQRLDELERYVGDSADKHFKELEAMKKSHGSQAERMQGFHANHGTMAERLLRVETCLDGIEGSVARAYQQTDKVTQTLQKEIQAKEAMMQELKAAYQDLEKQFQASGRQRSTSAPKRVNSPPRYDMNPRVIYPAEATITVREPIGVNSSMSPYSGSVVREPNVMRSPSSPYSGSVAYSSTPSTAATPVRARQLDSTDELFNKIDNNHDGVISPREFSDYMSRDRSPRIHPEINNIRR